MFEPSFHFSQIFWFQGLILIPIVIIWRIFTGSSVRQGQEKAYADKALLPFLTGISHQERGIPWFRIWLWCLTWTCLLTAMAEPRWDAKQVATYQPNVDLILLLDISRSMNAKDAKPSRLRRAKQEIEDLLEANQEYKMGFIAFASVPAIIAPITFDKTSILTPLPSLSSYLVSLKGSRLQPALERALELLQSQPKKNSHHLVLFSDGDFDNPDLLSFVKKLPQKNIFLHIIGMGKKSGAPVPIEGGQHLLDKSGMLLKSYLNEIELKALASAGGGIYLPATYANTETLALLQNIQQHAQKQEKNSKTLVWSAYYQWFILIALFALIFISPIITKQGN